MKFYEKIINREDFNPNWKVLALINSSEILLKELHLTGEKEILEEINIKLAQVVALAKDKNYHNLLAQAYWLCAQLSLAELDIEKAKDFLFKAKVITEDKELKNLAENIFTEQQKLKDNLELWQKLAKQKKPIIESLEQLTLQDDLTKIKKEVILEERDSKTGDLNQYTTLYVLRI